MNEDYSFYYADIKSCTCNMEVELNNILEFICFAGKNKINTIFKLTNQINSDFLFILNSVVYKIPAAGYKTVEDYKSAVLNKFPDSESYYDAAKGGFASFAEFQESKKIGAEEKEDFLKAKNTGFIEGYEIFKNEYEDLLKNPHIKNLDSDLNSAVKLYKFALRKGFQNYNSFANALAAGFTDFLTFTEAKSKGFLKVGDYQAATKMGFDNLKEFLDADSKSIRNKKEYNQYLYFKKILKDDTAHDEFQLIEILKSLDNGKILSSFEIISLLKEAQQKYLVEKISDNKKYLPIWYKQKFNSNENLCRFLILNSEIKKLGFFDSEKETFEIFIPSKEKIYIDASNVAYNSHGNEKAKPKFSNIKHVVNELLSRNYKNITIIADASLRHSADDVDILRKFPKEVKYNEAPAHTSADEFLIHSAKNDKCFIISNDTFKDWKIKDRWIANNIDRLRIPFMISENRVILSGLEIQNEDQHIKNNLN